MSLSVGPFAAADRPRWTALWTGYLDFYRTVLPQAVFDRQWERLMDGREIMGLAARLDGGIVGITHYMYHPHGWTLGPCCYLQDLFVDPAVRGAGAGRALIEAVAVAARTHGAEKLYWLTQGDNATARQLYDRLARHNGFIRYDYPPL
jgi:GNAT superfamily N-acetyltransferase